MNSIASRPQLTTRILGALAGLVLFAFASGLAQPSTASAASAGWYYHQLDSDRYWDAAQWWNGYRWIGRYWLDTNNDGSFGETYVDDSDRNGSADVFCMRRGNSGNWAVAIDVRTGTIYQNENQWNYYGYQHQGLGTYWQSQGNYQATVGPPWNPSGAHNLAMSFARQGYVYYG
jgi:hypothetical protein